MPLYEYQCDACGHRFEHIQKFSDAPLSTCPKCDGVLKKLVSSPAFHFKGTGWYVTDYAKKGAPGAPSEEGKSSDGTDTASKKKDATSSDSKSSSDSSKSASDSSKPTGTSSKSTNGSGSTSSDSK
jgi:putative FmdB family regulatory protein